MSLCVFASSLSAVLQLWTVLAAACWLLLHAGEVGLISKGVKERVRLLRFSNRIAEHDGTCGRCVGFAGLTEAHRFGAESSHGVWNCCWF